MSEPLDNFLVRAYLGGEMDEETAQAFEIRMIEEPDLAELVDADYALGAGLKLAGIGVPAPVAAPVTADVVALPAQPRSTHARRIGRVVPWLAAAGVVLATGIGVGRMAQPPRAAFEPATLVNVDKTRGPVGTIGEGMTAAVPASGWAVLFVPVATEKKSCLTRVQIDQNGTVLTAETKMDVSKFANFVVDASRLSPGSAVVSVGCVGDAPVTYAMTFRRL